MKSTWIAAAFAAIAPSLIGATVSTFSQTGCVTKQSTKSTNKIPTSTRSYTLTFNPKVTVVTTSTKTIIPSSTTVTAITTSTSIVTEILSQVTDTATATITDTETESATTTLISTELTTLTDVVTSSETLTIPASAGFTPLASQLVAQGYTVGTMRKRSATRRIARAPDNVEPRLERRAGPVKISKSGTKQYPVAVSCYRFVQIVSISTVKSTARSAQTITAIPGTITVTSTTVEPTTTTSMPFDASVTITTSTTTTITNTATETSTTTLTLTTTSTSFAPLATFYAACGSDNQVSSVNGRELYNYNPRFAFEETTAASAYDCCVRCLQSSTCGSSLFSAAAGNYCGLVNGSGTCNPTEDTMDLYASGSSDVYSVASNSNCGRASSNILGF